MSKAPLITQAGFLPARGTFSVGKLRVLLKANEKMDVSNRCVDASTVRNDNKLKDCLNVY